MPHLTSLRRQVRPATPLVLLVAGLIALAGCATGQRPTLVSIPPVTDGAIAAVIERLDRVDDLDFVATYDITSRFGGAAATATVEQSGSRRQIVVGPIEFLIDGATTRTCNTDTGECVDAIDDARISDLQVTHRFFGDSARDRLEVDAGRTVADTSGTTQTIAGQPAACAAVTVAGGTKTYCALDLGPLARFDGADVTIEMTSFTPST